MINAVTARGVAWDRSQRTLFERVRDEMESVEAAIINEARNERFSTMLDFTRADVAEEVMAKLIELGYQVHVSVFRSTNGADGDAVPSLEVRW